LKSVLAIHKWLLMPLFLAVSFSVAAKEFHVSVIGNNEADGSQEKPFKTISAASLLAKPGYVVIVHAGVYREWVNPRFGGTNELNRIVYKAAPSELVIIKGSEVIKNWQRVSRNVWKVTLPNSYFGSYNPYRDTLFADWFNSKGRVHHTGEVYLNGKSFYEVETLAKVENPLPLKDAIDQPGSINVWYCSSSFDSITIWANFHNSDPNRELTEINVRPTCFYPSQIGINFITVSGFHLQQAATQWAPPTAEQTGIIGPHWAKGWIIENNIISDSKCAGISLGKEYSTGQNFGVHKRMKLGFQYQLEVVFKALQIGWSKETVGSHIVRNNVIYDCEQAGIVGHLGAVFSKIYNNHIYKIHVKRQFTGDEMAGIKLHASIDVLIQNNRINDCGTFGIWLDWQCQGTRLSRNLLYRNTNDLFSEVNHGPYLVDNNILLSPIGIRNYSQGGAFVHNLITGKMVQKDVTNRYTPYHYPHSTQVAGTSIINGGDDRFYNNVFAVKKSSPLDSLNGESYGLNLYDGYLASQKAYSDALKKENNVYVVTFAKVKQPVWIASNIYFNGGKSCVHEQNEVVDEGFDPDISIEERGEEVFLVIKANSSFSKVKTQLITTSILGAPRISESLYENLDGSPLKIDQDYEGMSRSSTSPKVGPFEKLELGEQKIKVW